MINTNDLMVGNLIKLKTSNKTAKVLRLGDEKEFPIAILVYDDYFKMKIIKSVKEEQVDPIFLCEELLIEYGFKKEYDKILKCVDYKIDLGDFHITINDYCSNLKDKEWCIHIDNISYSTVGSGDINYFHELQNLIKIICGLELIKKKKTDDEI